MSAHALTSRRKIGRLHKFRWDSFGSRTVFATTPADRQLIPQIRTKRCCAEVVSSGVLSWSSTSPTLFSTSPRARLHTLVCHRPRAIDGVAPAQASGRMFWFMRKKFFGSYFALICWSRR